jgi:PAS domain S-box-containing protein
LHKNTVSENYFLNDEQRLLAEEPCIKMRKTPGTKNYAKAGSSPVSSAEMLYRFAFENSLQANIITTVRNGKIITVNKAACKLLGYSKKDLLTKKRDAIFDINERGFKKMLKQRTAEGHSIASVKAIKKKGRRFSCEITSALFRDEDGIEKMITTVTDISKSILAQKNIDTQKEKIVADNIIRAKTKQKNIDIRNKKITAGNIVLAKTKQKDVDIKKDKIVADNIKQALAKSNAMQAAFSEWIKRIGRELYDVMWDWNIATGEIYVGNSIEEVFGYKIKNNTVTFGDFSQCLLPADKGRVKKKLLKILSSRKKSWNDTFKFICRDGTVALTMSRANIVRDEKGKAIRLIGAIQDVSRLHELEEKLEEQIVKKMEHREIFQLAAKLSYDGIWDWNMLTNDFFLGEGFEDLFGYAIKKTSGNMADWSKHLHPDDKEAVEKGLQDAILSSATNWEHAYRFIRADGSVANVFGRASIIRDANGKAYRMIGAVHDLSRQKELEEKLDHEIKIKKRQISEAREEAAETERSGIGKELHDNVNQLLGISRLYLEMFTQGGENSKMYLNRSSEYIVSAIEEIRKLSQGLTADIIKSLGLCESIDNIARDTMEVSPFRISCELKSFKENSVNNKFKLNVFRIVQEQLNNISKHANATKVMISLIQDKKIIKLTISDNGVGFNTHKKHKGIGIDNIKSRTTTYNGTATFDSRPGHGCILTVTFPVTKALLQKS